MFNKECLINSASKVNEFTINVDIKGVPNPNIYQLYGYDHDTDPQYALGSIDKIPYWYFGSNNNRRWLEKLGCSYKESENNYTTSLYINSWLLDNEIYFTNDVGLVGRARLSSNSVYFDNNNNDIFNIVSRYKSGNRAMKFKTDPPPDGYLDPKTLNPI